MKLTCNCFCAIQSGKYLFKGALSGLRQFLATGHPLKIMKIVFYFTSKALFVLKIFRFLSWRFGHVSKRVDQKDKVNFKFYDVTAWLTNTCSAHIDQYLEKKKQSDNESWSVNRSKMRSIYLEKSYTKCGWETSPRPFFKKSKLSISLNQ